MALKKCKECGKEISTKAETCPHCGSKQKRKGLGCGSLFIIILAVLIIGYYAADDAGTYNTPPPTTSETEPLPNRPVPVIVQQEPDLLLLDWNWKKDGDYTYVEGQVKNVSLEPMKGVEAVVSFKTQDGALVTSDTSFIEYQPVMPGQVSPFKTMTRWNPQMETVSLNFKYWAGQAIYWEKAE